MIKKLAVFCALLALVAGSAYAEVQNIKVSGDIDALAIYRDNYDMEDGRLEDTAASAGKNSYVYGADDEDGMLMSIIRLRVDADLTDNVGTTVRLANLREWDTVGTEESDIILDLAYVTLREMLYSPLTVIIGRQELNYGNGLIVGNGRHLDPNGTITYTDLSPLTGYDAVRAILDYDPWTFDMVAVKLTESDDDAVSLTNARDDDVDLYGANVGYKFGVYDAEAEGYLFYKRDPEYNLVITKSGSASNGRTFEQANIYTLGLRGSAVPLDNLKLNGELAFQLGTLIDDQAGPTANSLERDVQAMAADIAGVYDFTDIRFKPTLGLEYLYLSGEEAAQSGDFEQWHPMYRGKVMGNIRDYLETLYVTNDPADTSGYTNQHTIKAMGSVDLGELVDGLSMDLAYLHYWFAEEPLTGVEDGIGDEFNMKLAYDYTEDVQFALDGAWFLAGDYYGKELHSVIPMTGGSTLTNTVTSRTANDDIVSIVGSCKVTF